MNPKTSPLTRRMALGAIVGSALLTALPAMAQHQMVNVRVINRDSGEILPLYRHRGEFWVAGEPGARYAVELYNPTRGRLLNVVSVDGVNVITGETADFDQPGYVLAPGQRYDVSGWRKSRREIAAFEFTRLSRSYAARTGRPDDVGVIGVAVFRERRFYRAPEPEIRPYERSAPVPGEDTGPAFQGKSHRWSEPSAAGPQLGTGHGDRERDPVGRTDFERRSSRPDEIVRIRYDSRANLMAMGIIPADQRPPREYHPRAFPGARPGYVPDPE